MHNKLSVTALAGFLALTTSGSDSGKTIFQLSSTGFSPKKLDLPTSFKPAPKLQNTSQKPDLYPPGLIQSTDIAQRLKQVQYGRPDPFTGVLPQVEIAPPPQKVFPDLPKLTTVKALPAPTKPTPPSTDLAKGVAIEGVVQTENESHAIIKLPQDSTSRYVSEGQQLADGQLLIKKIEITPDSDPIVVLEQNGIEIAKAVGEPANSEETEESTDIASSMGVPSDSEATDSEATDSEATDSEATSLETTDREAAEPIEATQPTEEYTAAIPVPSPPPLASSATKKQRDKVADPPAPTNYKPPVDIASVGEDYPNETVLSSSNVVSVRSDGRAQNRIKHRASSDRAGQEQAVDSPYTSSSDLPEKQPQFTASANVENPTERQQLIERLRYNSTSPVGNSIESNSIPAFIANVEGTPKQQLINQLRSEKPLTSDELSTQNDTRVLLHKQQLINQLRSSNAMPIDK